MIFVTGDIHGEIDIHKLASKNFPNEKEMTKNDYLVILGDFGLIWDCNGENKTEKYWLNWLDKKPYTTLFLDGNHENYERLNNDYPVEEWNGGKVHKIRPSVIHLMRGQVFNIDDALCFTFGGASSHDISDGVLDPNNEEERLTIEEWKKDPNKMFRVLGVSWWKEELPNKEEMMEGTKNLLNVSNKVDFIFSHCCSTSSQVFVSSSCKNDVLTDYLEELKGRLEYKKWYFGHYHVDRAVNDKEIVVYDDIVQIR